MFGSYMWKSWSTNQALISLLSGEAEYYALVKAGSVGIGAQPVANEMGPQFQNSVEFQPDVMEAICICWSWTDPTYRGDAIMVKGQGE